MKNLKPLFAILACTALIGGCADMPGAAPAATPAPTPAAPAAPAEDAALNAKVMAALKADQYVGKFDLKSTANTAGEVTVSGKVRNEFQQYQAGAAAKAVAGVTKVDNKVKLDE